MILPESLLILYKEYISNNHIFYIVGGAVRDNLLNLIPKDYDCVTHADIEQTIAILEKLGYQYINDNYHSVIKIKQLDIEITRFRRDLKEGFEFNVGIGEDAKRRDLTYNAIYYDITNHQYIDFYNGINDLNNGVIRMIGDPCRRIKEDKTRVLRILKYAARYHHHINFEINDDLFRNFSRNYCQRSI